MGIYQKMLRPLILIKRAWHARLLNGKHSGAYVDQDGDGPAHHLGYC